MNTNPRKQILLSNVPPELHRKLKDDAKAQKRTIPAQAVHTLESALLKPSKKPRP